MTSKQEEECKRIAEKIFRVTFEKRRFIVNPETGRMLEIDMMSPDGTFGIEWNGYQHYVYPNRYHKTEKEFIAQVRRDDYKRKWCKYKGIKLITVPYNIGNIEKYLTDKKASLKI